jgi:signal transduction histidine kinase
VFTSLRLRLTFSHLLVIVLAMALSGFLLLSFLERYFLEAAEESLLAQARITAQALIPGALVEGAGEVPTGTGEWNAAANALQQQQLSNLSLQAENIALPDGSTSLGEADLSYLSDASLQLSTQLATRIRILDENGDVLVDSGMGGQYPAGADLQEDPLVQRALAGAYASHVTEDSGETTMALALPAMVGDRVAGVVYLSQPLSDVASVLRDLRTRWLLSGVVALLCSGLIGFLLARAISSPLRRLTAAAASVAEGQFDQQVPVSTRDEVGRLSQTFNDMVARLQAARQAQVDFVADVSHELRTPLTAIKGTVETLRDGAADDPLVRDRFLETVENETDRLVRLVNELITLSRADSEALNLRRAPVDMVALTKGVVERLDTQARAKGITCRVQAGRVPMAWADADRVEQVLVNLLDNAYKFSKPDGEVLIKLGVSPEHGDAVLVEVRDKGIGIPAEELPRIGQRFYRTDKARSRAQGGTGLGLAIAQALVQAHGGQLWLQGESGAGTTASFTLPRA